MSHGSVRRTRWLLIVPAALIVLAVGGSWLYLNVIQDDPPERLRLESSATATTTPATTDPSSSTTVDGTWEPTSGSQLGYRVKEILFGQSATAVGRTGDVTGKLVISGSSVSSGSFTADMTTVSSDQSRRDNQFRGRIMDVESHPTATFALTEPIDLGSVPAVGATINATAKGNLTLRGTTKPVTVTVHARLSAGKIQITGSIPVVFADYDIPNPSFGPADTEDHGEVEFLLVLAKRA